MQTEKEYTVSQAEMTLIRLLVRFSKPKLSKILEVILKTSFKFRDRLTSRDKVR